MKKDLDYTIPIESLALDPCKLYSRLEAKMHRAFGWQQETRDSYKNYVQQLKPFLRKIPFSECTADDYGKAIIALNEARPTKGERPYAENTLKSIRSVINDLCYFVEVYSKGAYKNTLWGSAWNKEKRPSKRIDRQKEKQKRIDKQVKLPRSLNITQEVKLLNVVEEKYLHDSYYLGIAVLFYMGLRPGECCGVQFRDICPLDGYPDTQCMYVYEQVNAAAEATNELKTKNAYRVLPIPSELAALIEKRRAVVEERLPGKSGQCYLVCEGEETEELQRQCDRRKFRVCCQDLLREISVEEAVVTNLYSLIEAKKVAEASVTSYLLRRNFATALAGVCGMEDDELKYEMGHSLHDQEEHRYDFLNPDTMHHLWEKLERRKYHTKEGRDPVARLTEGQGLLLRQKEVTLSAEKESLGANGVFLGIWNEYPNDYIQVEIQSGEPAAIEYRTSAEPVVLKKAARVMIHHEFIEAVEKFRDKIKT